MGDPRHCSTHSPYLYTAHTIPIHSASHRTSQRAAVVKQPLESTCLLDADRGPHSSQTQGLQSPPTVVISQPPFQASQIDGEKASASLAPLPAVIVSPHYVGPTTERDPHPARPVAKKIPARLDTTREHLDGSTDTVHNVPSSGAPMTSRNGNMMGSSREEGAPILRPQRPSIVSQHSNSVPSTPLQVARQYGSRSRSPSPNGGLGSHSPRSVSSEANSTMPTLRIGRIARCQYETNDAFGRRRMPYTSSDILGKTKEEPKKTLDPLEDKKLTDDMRVLHDRLLPSAENSARRDQFVQKLQSILEAEFPGNEFKVHVFGSSGNMLYTSESDVDICIQTPMKKLEEMHGLAEALAKHGMQKVVCIPQAKVRIVKVWDPVLKLACDMNVNNTLALENTRMVKTYVQIDERVRPLAMIIKYWTKQRILNDAARGGTISSYTWICMILNFLQTRNPPILPSLQDSPQRAVDPNTGKPSESEFADDISKLAGFGTENKESLGQLLFNFFRLYGHEMDYEKHVISLRHGRLLTREEKNWHLDGLQKEARNRLCVEEPFNTERNLGNSADDHAWRGIHLEIRRAFDLLADAQQLEKTCEQFEFPAEEKSTPLFRKPQATKTTLTPVAPPRGGGRGGHRGGRGGFNQKGSGSYGRRASSGASFGANRPPFLHSPPIGAMPSGPQEYFPRGLNEQLHDQLFQQYQMLEMQSNSLRAQLMAQQQAQQAQQVRAAHMHAHVVAQAQAQHNRGASSTNGSPQKSPYINGNGSSPRLGNVPPNALPQGFLYHYPGFLDPTQAAATMSQDGTRTNPSSPSLPHSVPGLRRQIHRASNASETGSLRSHSQPPRGLPQPSVLNPHIPPISLPYDPATFAGYPIVRSTQEAKGAQVAPEIQNSPLLNYPEPTAPVDRGIPREYVGYYVDEPPPSRSLQEYSVSQIPSFSELAQRRRRVSQEITQPFLSTALRRVSRSPSPLGGHMRSYSIGVTPPSGATAEQRKDRADSARPLVDNGPVIVNGSFPTPSREPRTRSGTVDALPATDVANPVALGIYLSQDQYKVPNLEQRHQFALQEMQRQNQQDVPGPSIANGSMNAGPSGDLNSLIRISSGNKQQLPILPTAFTNFNLRNGSREDHAEEVSPTRIQAPQFRVSPYSNGILSALDTINAPRPPPQEIKSATLPLLSPVFETRTPSPTANRQLAAGKQVNGTKAQSKENHQQGRRASHSPAQRSVSKENRNNQQKGKEHSNEKSSKPNTGSNGNNKSNDWQQTQPRKNRNKNKKGGASKANDNKTSGEPIPANASDRKGG